MSEDVVCNRCKGKGFVEVYDDFMAHHGCSMKSEKCKDCEGAGKLRLRVLAVHADRNIQEHECLFARIKAQEETIAIREAQLRASQQRVEELEYACCKAFEAGAAWCAAEVRGVKIKMNKEQFLLSIGLTPKAFWRD